MPSVSALKFNGSLNIAVGTSTGQVHQNCVLASTLNGGFLGGGLPLHICLGAKANIVTVFRIGYILLVCFYIVVCFNFHCVLPFYC